MSADLYTELGIERTATQAEIKAAHRARVRETHPDANPEQGAERFRAVQTAYEVLSCPERRARYDATGEDGRGQREQAADAILETLFSQAVKTCRIDDDVIGLVRSRVRTGVQAVRERMTAWQVSESRYAQLLERTQSTGCSMLVRCIETELEQARATLAELADELESLECASRILSVYQPKKAQAKKAAPADAMSRSFTALLAQLEGAA